ncbi:MAG: glycoside hydrolase family 99-like domain-containing protein, partial [Betaproteobacteria bacterium]
MSDPRTTVAATGAGDDLRLIAFYLPQYHPIPENDRWWGDGFTEWTNVRKAKPNFAGHYQPHEPGELGYYDLRDPGVRDRQAALAREHGIHGFCYYYYWFNGKRLLERPLDEMLASGKPDFPFCVCWANENWTRRWDGREQDVLMAQHYSSDDSRAFIRSLFPLMRDRRYIQVDGRPLLLIYKIALIPELPATLALWRDECRNAGLGEIYLVAAMTTWEGNPEGMGLDAAVEFPPHGHRAERVNDKLALSNPRFSGWVFNFRSYVAQLMTMPRPDFTLFRTVVPSWDNTARQQDT